MSMKYAPYNVKIMLFFKLILVLCKIYFLLYPKKRAKLVSIALSEYTNVYTIF